MGNAAVGEGAVTERRAEERRLPVSVFLSSLVPRRRRRGAGYAVALLGGLGLALAFLPIRDHSSPLSKGFGFMAVVIAAAAVGGLGSGILASLLGFVLFNFLFIPPYGTFYIARGEDVIVLFVFLGLSVLISALLAREAERAEAAEAREAELEILQELSRELVTRVPGPETYEPALSRLLRLFGFTAGSLQVPRREGSKLHDQVTVGAEPGTIGASWEPESGQSLVRFPLSVGRRNLGLVVLRGDRPALTPRESRVLRAFCDELALVLERDRLLAAAAEADVYRRTDRVRRSLFGAVSHELRSPLAAIKASVTDLLAQRRPHRRRVPAGSPGGSQQRGGPAGRAHLQPPRHVEDRSGEPSGPPSDLRPG